MERRLRTADNLKNGYELKKTGGDRELLFTVIFLVVIGFMAVVSASMPLCLANNTTPLFYVIRHLFWMTLGGLGLWFFSRFEYGNLRRYTFTFAFGVIILLLIVKFTPLGMTINGARRWINLGFFQFQPSEFSKLAFILLLGSLFSLKQEVFKAKLPKYLITSGIMLFVVLKQPNLSMTLILLAIGFCMYVCSGKTLKPVFIGGLILLGLGTLVLTNIIDLSNYIEPFQIARFKNWLASLLSGKTFDTQGGGYQVYHSLIAIASGGMFGCGYGAGKEKLGWLPEAHTDFIFSVLSEELGFIGSLLIIILFLTLLYRGINIALKCPSIYGRLVGFGITVSITIQAFFNIAVATSFMPATGITLPFISYGGSSLFVSMCMAGVLLNISKIKMARISHINSNKIESV